jgi:dephospho-CoA kinase
MTKTIGLTGNIACGKSTVAALLRDLGAEVIDADQVARAVMAPPGPVFDAVVQAFGPGILTPAGQIDRAALGAIVFHDPAALRRLDALVHPATGAAIRERLRQSTAPVVVVEAIKLIESGTYRILDSIWLVTCTPEQQVERLMAQRGLDRAAAQARVAAQAPASEKLPYAAVVIDASQSLADTRRQVLEAWQKL